jgi:hypothetical protein
VDGDAPPESLIPSRTPYNRRASRRLAQHAGDCLKAVRLLNKSTIDTGKKMASDPAFNLAAELLAAELNVVAGAGTCPAVVSAINGTQTLLAATHFT